MKNIFNTLLSGFDRIVGLSEWFDTIFLSFHNECYCMQHNCQPAEACCCHECCCC